MKRNYKIKTHLFSIPPEAAADGRRHMSTDAAHVHGGLLAVMQAECEARQLPYAGIPVGTIKKAATGKGNAGKGEMVPIYRPKTHFHREVEGYEDGPF
jgi:crossover junction endodeoxyribonuclease RuvC